MQNWWALIGNSLNRNSRSSIRNSLRNDSELTQNLGRIHQELIQNTFTSHSQLSQNSFRAHSEPLVQNSLGTQAELTQSSFRPMVPCTLWPLVTVVLGKKYRDSFSFFLPFFIVTFLIFFFCLTLQLPSSSSSHSDVLHRCKKLGEEVSNFVGLSLQLIFGAH